MFNLKWHLRFIDAAKLHASWSKDPSTKCGCSIVRPDKTEASYGYNGFPSCMRDDEELYKDRTIKYSRVIHAEMNGLINAAENLKGYICYTWPMCPCDRCTVHLLQAGIKIFVFPKCPEDKLYRYYDIIILSKHYIEQSNRKWFEIDGEKITESSGQNIFLGKVILSDEEKEIVRNYQREHCNEENNDSDFAD